MIQIFKGGVELTHKQWLFPGGEVGVKLDVNNLAYLHTAAPYATIVARIRNSADILELAMARDALERFDTSTLIRLFLPYVPYGRQDRVMVPGESFSVYVFAKLIRAMQFDRVTIVDPHSEVTGGVFEALGANLRVISQFDVIHQFRAFSTRVQKGSIFVSPDAGANKKTSQLAAYYGHSEFIRADKLRNLATGEIKETIVYRDNLAGSDTVICDDLCDGGRTFTELAKVLKAKGASRVILYVTHGIFSKGTDALLKHGIDEIYTTDSWGGVTQHDLGANVTTLKLQDVFPL